MLAVERMLCVQATGASRERISSLWKRHADIGDVVFECRQRQQTLTRMRPLTVREVFTSLRDIVRMEGSKSVARKRETVVRLLARAGPAEGKYFVRILSCNLRF